MSENLAFKGRTVLVTGGTRNIGLGFAEAFAIRGADVAVIGHSDRRALETTLALLAARGVRAEGELVDLADADAVVDATSALTSRIGEIDILINNAAVRPHAPLADISTDDFDRVLAVNLRAPFVIARQLLPGMAQRGWGRVINIGGIHGHMGVSERPHVSASKGGLSGLTRGLAAEFTGTGVTVNELVAGAVDTRKRPAESAGRGPTPLGRYGTIDEIVGLALYLASESASYVTGQSVFAAGGMNSLL